MAASGSRSIRVGINGATVGTATIGGIGPRKTAGSTGTATNGSITSQRSSPFQPLVTPASLRTVTPQVRMAIRLDTVAIMVRSTRVATTGSRESRSDLALVVDLESGGNAVPCWNSTAFLSPGKAVCVCAGHRENQTLKHESRCRCENGETPDRGQTGEGQRHNTTSRMRSARCRLNMVCDGEEANQLSLLQRRVRPAPDT